MQAGNRRHRVVPGVAERNRRVEQVALQPHQVQCFGASTTHLVEHHRRAVQRVDMAGPGRQHHASLAEPQPTSSTHSGTTEAGAAASGGTARCVPTAGARKLRHLHAENGSPSAPCGTDHAVGPGRPAESVCRASVRRPCIPSAARHRAIPLVDPPAGVRANRATSTLTWPHLTHQFARAVLDISVLRADELRAQVESIGA